MSLRIPVLALPLLLLAAAAAAATPGAERLVQPVVVAGTAEVQLEWARRLEHGEGIARDPAQALIFYCAAARQGSPEAAYRLGWIYLNGLLGRRDDDLAAAWLGLAAAGGDAQARHLLERLTQAKDPEPRCVEAGGQTFLVLAHPPSATDREGVEQVVATLAPRYGLDPAMVLAVIRVESGFDPKAVSPKGAQGLMQLIPATASRFGVRDPFDPLQSLQGGMAYLRWLLRRFRGDLSLALAGYNAGEGAVERFGGVPPFPETQRYIRLVNQAYRHDAGDGRG
jgi:Transglycosylase SLT domain/Sel1 repeat